MTCIHKTHKNGLWSGKNLFRLLSNRNTFPQISEISDRHSSEIVQSLWTRESIFEYLSCSNSSSRRFLHGKLLLWKDLLQFALSQVSELANSELGNKMQFVLWPFKSEENKLDLTIRFGLENFWFLTYLTKYFPRPTFTEIPKNDANVSLL